MLFPHIIGHIAAGNNKEVKWTPLSRPKNGDPSLHSHQALVALIPRHADAEASYLRDRSKCFIDTEIKTTTNLDLLLYRHLALVAPFPR
jgi:hypothetical protein